MIRFPTHSQDLLQKVKGEFCYWLEGLRGEVNFCDRVQVAIGCSCTPLEVDTLCLVWELLEVVVPPILIAGLGVGSVCIVHVFESCFWTLFVKGLDR